MTRKWNPVTVKLLVHPFWKTAWQEKGHKIYEEKIGGDIRVDVDGLEHADYPGLALHKTYNGRWGITHMASGMSVTSTDLQRESKAVLIALGKLAKNLKFKWIWKVRRLPLKKHGAAISRTISRAGGRTVRSVG